MPQPTYASDKHPRPEDTAYPPSSDSDVGPTSATKPEALVGMRDISRTPSPTPSELGEKKQRSWQELLRTRLYVFVPELGR
jgi:hypothetical protein